MRTVRRVLGTAAIVAGLAPVTAPAVAAQGRPFDLVRSEVESLLVRLGGTVDVTALDSLLRAGVLSLVEDPAFLNRTMGRLFRDTTRYRLLYDLNLRFKTFKADDSDLTGLGLSYEYARDLARQTFEASAARHTQLALRFSAAGNVAFERDLNPRDFLATRLNFGYWRSAGGATTSSDDQRRLLNELGDSLTAIEDRAELMSSAVWRRFLGIASRYLTTQVVTAVGADFSFETDQAFIQRQLVYGGAVGLDLKAWNRSSVLARWNFFDWPFAALRYLTGTDAGFEPRGSTIPTVRAAIGLVDPIANDGRAELDELGTYPRLNLEVAFRTLVWSRSGRQLFFEADGRWYRELGASAAITAAALHDFTYFAGALVETSGFFVSYSTGRLPLDRQSDQVYQLGFKLGL